MPTAATQAGSGARAELGQTPSDPARYPSGSARHFQRQGRVNARQQVRCQGLFFDRNGNRAPALLRQHRQRQTPRANVVQREIIADHIV
jgi:hypothetical protein